MKRTVVLLVAVLLVIFVNCALSDKSKTHVDLSGLEYAIKSRTQARVFLKGTPQYAWHRVVANGGCKDIYPALVVQPKNTKDVSEIVKISTEFQIDISVRGGGHSYQCQGTKQDSLNIDMRRLKKVKLLSPHEALIGAGNTFKGKHFVFLETFKC